MKTARLIMQLIASMFSGDIKVVGKKSAWQPYRLHKKTAPEINRFVRVEMEEGKTSGFYQCHHDMANRIP